MSTIRLVALSVWLCLSGVSSHLMADDTSNQASLRSEEGQAFRPVVVAALPFSIAEQYARDSEVSRFIEETSPLQQASMLQPMPLILPRGEVTPELGLTVSTNGIAAGASTNFAARLYGGGRADRSLLRKAKLGSPSLSVDVIRGAEAAPLTSTDLGHLLKRSTSALSVETQSRTPIVGDSRIRGSRAGSLAASGSHWVPARADLDTAMNKIDSRQIRDVIVIPGPYSSVYGPAFNYLDFQLESSPRYENGRETHGNSSFEHKSNGNQWLGQQTLLVGGQDWGIRGSYAHRRGSNYRSGDGVSTASSYESRIFNIAMGKDFDADRSIELSLLRLDQTDVEFPGFVFDINNLVTDGYEAVYSNSDSWIGDRTETEIWYNRTDFNGDSDNPEKQNQFPFLAFVDFNGVTDADVMSTGYRRAISWGIQPDELRFTVGHDLRFIKQEVNEVFDTLRLGAPARFFGQAPLPRSFSVNPGLFAEYYERFCDVYAFQSGLRLDYVQTDITEDPANLQSVGLTGRTYEDVIGTNLSQRDRLLWSLYGRLEKKISPQLTGSVSVGYAERAPTLTELYGVEQLLLMVQNGLNTLTGDPRLKTEKLIQFDVSADYEGKWFRGGARGYHGWAFDYITFENTGVVIFNGSVVQTNLRAVNTRLATLAGFEAYAEVAPKEPLTLFAIAKGSDGRDRTRNGDFATRAANTFFASERIAGLPRGAFSFVPGNDSESLPGISPFETRLGVRLRDNVDEPQWIVELAARVVDNQDRVASSLLEFATPGFTVWDLRTVWQPRQWDRLTVYSGVENFTDKAYREHLDFQSRAGVSVLQPGATFYVGADIDY